jgi:predicted MFS family arabinose efflux permease
MRPKIGRAGLVLLATATMSRLADNAAAIALVLLIIARTHDPRLAGLVVGAFTVPTLVTGPVLGAHLDRMRRKRPLFAANQVLLAAALAGVLAVAGHGPGWLLAVFGLCAGLTAPVLTGGFSSLVPLVVPAGALGKANALDSASYDVAGLAGPGLVAAIAGVFGAGAALGSVAAVAAAGLLLVLVAPMPAAVAAGTGGGESLAAAVADGLRLLRDSRPLRAVTVAGAASQFFQGPLPVVLPLLAVALGRATSGGGWLLTAISAGGLIGSLLSDRLLMWLPGRTVFAGALFGFFACLAAMAVAPGFWDAMALAALAGLADGPSFAATLHVRQRNVPPDRYAQASATGASVKTGAYALGAAGAGLLAGLLTARQLMLVIAVGQLLAVLPLLPGASQRPEARGLVGAPGGEHRAVRAERQ